jgi:tetratricopeptide (TPR) repeat protein
VYGARGGLLRRLGESSTALDSYTLGAGFERRFVARSTYNWTNKIKYGLLTGLHSLVELEPEIGALEKHLTKSLSDEPELGDNGWAWADLGDLRALLGDGDGAERAYRSFIEKAKPTAPRTTLDVLGSILKELQRTNEERAATVRRSLEFVRDRLNLR